MKKFLKIVLFILAILFVIFLFVPDPKTEKSKIETDNNTSIEYKSEWYSTKDNKKERLIEKRIDGEWNRTFSIRYDTKSFDKETYEIGKGNYYHEKFIEGMLPKYYYEFSSKQEIKKNKDPLSYTIDKTTITFINPLSDNETESILFIGNRLMVRNAEINNIKLGGYDFYKKVGEDVQNDYKNELNDFLNSILLKGAEQVKAAASLINQGHQSDGFSKLTEGVSFLRIVSLSDTAMKKRVSGLLVGIKTEFSSNFDTFIETEISNLKQQIATSKNTDWKIEYLEKFQAQLSYLNVSHRPSTSCIH